MLIVHAIVAAVAVGALIASPRVVAAAVVVAAAAVVDVLLGADIGPAIAAVAPLLAFLTAALSLAAAVHGSGLCDRAADLVARSARGRGWAVFALVCAACAAATAVVSLDGAVVLLVPVVLSLHRRFAAPLAPLLVGAVAVANVASIAVPQGNPTNLVVMDRLGISAGAFVTHMLIPGAVAATGCATAVALTQRRALTGCVATPTSHRAPLTTQERHAALALVAGGVAAWIAPLAGVAPWWPFAAVVAAALAFGPARTRPKVPWRIAVQVGGLVVVAHALGLSAPVPASPGVLGLMAMALAVGALAAVANNLPTSVWTASLLGAGPLAYAATIGLGAGALATPQGSVATLIAADLAGAESRPLRFARLAPLAGIALVIASLLLAARV